MASATPRPTRSSHHNLQIHFNSDNPRKRQKFVTGAVESERWDEIEEAPGGLGESQAQSAQSRRDRTAPTPSSTAAEAAAATQVDGYKPREERSWEEFHPDLDTEIPLRIFTADEVDGKTEDSPSASPSAKGLSAAISSLNAFSNPSSPKRRGPGRPPRRPESMLTGLGSPPAPRIAPLPSQNPKERLNLPKPSFRKIQTFSKFENDPAQHVNYVDKGMAHVGYQESEMFSRPEPTLIRFEGSSTEDGNDNNLILDADRIVENEHHPVGVTRVEYDMDEQDERWLEAHNAYRKAEDGIDPIKPWIFEIAMTQIEKEWHALEKREFAPSQYAVGVEHSANSCAGIPKPNPKPPQTTRPRSNSAAAVNGEASTAGEEQDSKCSICDDGDCENTNAIIFCDGCDIAVHQECYGVPFIPEGQWLCRKCQNIGRGVPTCIFCPNTEGAFKLTTEQRWAHLLCAIWIPEVSLANASLMEPIDGVAKVPKPRWKLTCYICQQKMGACIQCGNRNCFQAFHVTCARRAKLFLKMKSAHGALATLDASVLKALCDKHVPEDWEQEYHTAKATADAKAFYRKAMKGRQWADSQMSALAMVHQSSVQSEVPINDARAATEDAQPAANTVAQRKKMQEAQKNLWRLPSGAPIVPQVVFDAIEYAIQKYSFRKRKEFIAEVCKYWTLKREARRGAALLKRLQLQMETFSSSEITRRDFVAMGPVGRTRLERRVEFVQQLLGDLDHVREMMCLVQEREATKLQDADLLRETLETIYFPINSMLLPVIDKALSLNANSQWKQTFADSLEQLRQRVHSRDYTSIATFGRDFADVFRCVPTLESAKDVFELYDILQGRSLREVTDVSAESKELLKLAKRIIASVGPMLQDSARKEAELVSLKSVNTDDALSRPSVIQATVESADPADEPAPKTEDHNLATPPEGEHGDDKQIEKPSTQENGDVARVSEEVGRQAPLTPPRSEKDMTTPFARGGIPEYLELFDISGTTIHDERWTGRDVLRGMSEELSEMGDEELLGLSSGMHEKKSASATLPSIEEGNGELDDSGSPDAVAKLKAPVKRRSGRTR